MAIELVTGHAGSAHVSSFDEAARMVYVFGSGTTILGDIPELLLPDANTVSIPACDIMMQGRFVRLTGTNTVSIESGTQGVYRTDTIMLRYTIDDAGIEGCSLFYVRGEDAASASDAEAAGTEYEGLNISDGATIVDVPIIHIALAALTPTASWVVESMDSTDSRLDDAETDIAGLQQSMTNQLNGSHIYGGSIVRNQASSGTTCRIWSKNEFMNTFHTSNPGLCGVCISDGEAAVLGVVMCAQYWSGGSDPGWFAKYVSSISSGQRRYNYIVVVPSEVSTV